jgi:hypothetical protein
MNILSDLSESVLIESKTVRDYQLARLDHQRASEILNKVKSLYFALWGGTGVATTQQVAEFYEVPEDNLRQLLKTYRLELESDGLKTIRGKDLSHARDLLSLPSKISQASLWTPRSVLRIGMPMRNSATAQVVRTTLLNIVEKVVPAQTQELERLKLELDLAKTQERLLATTNAIATLHGSEMLALMMGKPDAIVTRTERVETLIAVDNKGKAIASFDGIGITYLAKRYGFGKNTKACRYWLESIGVKDEQWIVEPTIVKTQKLSRDLLPWLDRQYAARTGVRQQLLGE